MIDKRKQLLSLAFIFAASILGVFAWAAGITTRAERLRTTWAQFSLDAESFVNKSPASPSTAHATSSHLAPTDPVAGQVVRFALYDAGILPREARVASGRVVISITDFTGGSVGLMVQRELDRTDVGQIRRDGARWRGRQELNLSPGIYRVFDVGRIQNRATLIVEP